MNVCIPKYAWMSIRILLCLHVLAWLIASAYVYIFMYVCVCARVFICLSTFVYVWVNVSMHVRNVCVCLTWLSTLHWTEIHPGNFTTTNNYSLSLEALGAWGELVGLCLFLLLSSCLFVCLCVSGWKCACVLCVCEYLCRCCECVKSRLSFVFHVLN